jgi:hypothetical protein
MTLAPYLERQWGPAFGTLQQIKQALDPAGVMNPGKLGFPVAVRSTSDSHTNGGPA